MSAIFGIFHLDGKPVSQEALGDMQNAMDYWGPDGSGIWREGNVGLGHLLMHNTPESLHEKLPMIDSLDGLVITASARIDNRDELFNALSIPHPRRVDMPDSQLILKAYQKWRDDSPDHLLGDWSFAIWNPRQRRLFIARDHHGNTGLFYYSNSRFLAFASSLKGLLALPEVPRRPDELRIAQVLVSWPGDGVATVYKDISRLPPAHTLTVTGEKIDVRRYWYLENTPDLRLGSDSEYLEAFLDVYTEAVRCRLRSNGSVGTTLSGGLDSGSVSALAARELGKNGERLAAFSSVPIHHVELPNNFADETPFIKATSEFAGNIDVNYIRAEDVTPLGGIERALDVHDEPGHAAGNQYWIIALMALAQEHNISTLLTGQGGNGTISWKGLHEELWRRLARSGQLRAAWGEANAWRRTANRTLWQMTKATLRCAMPTFMWSRYIQFKHGKSPWDRYSAINSRFAQSIGLADQMAANGHDPTFSAKKDARKQQFKVINPGKCIGGAFWSQSGAAFAMDARDPTQDKRVMTFCVSLPEDQFVHHGRDRLLIRRAMEGILPPEVQWNTVRGRQAADLGQRLLHIRPEMEAMMTRVAESELAQQYLDIARMQDIVETLYNEKRRLDARPIGAVVLRGLMVGLFLRRLENGHWNCVRDRQKYPVEGILTT